MTSVISQGSSCQGSGAAPNLGHIDSIGHLVSAARSQRKSLAPVTTALFFNPYRGQSPTAALVQSDSVDEMAKEAASATMHLGEQARRVVELPEVVSQLSPPSRHAVIDMILVQTTYQLQQVSMGHTEFGHRLLEIAHVNSELPEGQVEDIGEEFSLVANESDDAIQLVLASLGSPLRKLVDHPTGAMIDAAIVKELEGEGPDQIQPTLRA
jgi:hypothetical protein